MAESVSGSGEPNLLGKVSTLVSASPRGEEDVDWVSDFALRISVKS